LSDELVRVAKAAQESAYAPYSNFPVGAAIEAEDGQIFSGCNVENASTGLTICAERVAVGSAICSGVRRITKVIVVTDANPPSAPCGACRQVLAEFGDDIEIVAVGPGGSRSWNITDLLPDKFGRRDLESKGSK